MPTTRRAAGEPDTSDAVVITSMGDGTLGGDEVVVAESPRDSALAALLLSPQASIVDDAVAVTVQVRPLLTGDTVVFDPAGSRWLVWADVYARMAGENRLTARKGDIVVVPDDAVTASHVRLGHLIPE